MHGNHSARGRQQGAHQGKGKWPSRCGAASLKHLLLAVLVFGMFPCGSAQAEEPILNVLNWSDYIGPDTLSEFTARTGIKVNYDTFDSNEMLEAKLLAGKSGYDVVFPTAMPYFAKQVKAGVYRKLDLGKIPNAKGVDAQVMARLRASDSQNTFALPYTVSATAIGYIQKKIAPLIANPPIGSLAMVFDSNVVKALKPCGVTILDAPDEEFPAALAYMGRDPTSTSEADLEAASKLIGATRPFLRYFHSSKYISDLATGEICVSHGWTGDLFQARKRAKEANNGIEISIFIPKEGASSPVDVMAIPKDAPHPDNAHKFINFLLEPKVIAAITAAVGYANAVPASREFIPKEIIDDPVVYPPSNIKYYTPPLPTAKYDRERNRQWTRVKTGR